MIKWVLTNLESLTFEYVRTDLKAITKIFFSRKARENLKITWNMVVPEKRKCFVQ